MKIFIGMDKRQPIAYHVLRSSIERRASRPVDIQPLNIDHIPMKRTGLTEFSFTRYMVPYLCDYRGEALFMDADMIVLDDIYRLRDWTDGSHPVWVVKNQRRFEWSSLMYFNNFLCDRLTPELIETGTPQDFKWADEVGALPKEWNHLVFYDEPNPNAKIVHFSAGIPVWKETAKCEYSHEWMNEWRRMNSTVSFEELMGRSVHTAHLHNLSKVAG